ASGSSTYLSNFSAITTGSAGSNSAVPGYDLVTGLGSPHADVLVPNLRIAPAVVAAPASTSTTPKAVGSGKAKAVAASPASAIVLPVDSLTASQQLAFVLVPNTTGTMPPVVARPAVTIATGIPALTCSGV